jgi:hypothetical protein
MPSHLTATRLVFTGLTGLALGLSACDTDDDSSPPNVSGVVVESGADTESDTTEATATASDAPGGDPTSAAPTGQLTLDGVTVELTFDTDDPNALCQRLPGDSMVVSGMRTPEGNRVDVTVQDVPRDNAMATYFGDDEIPLWSAATDGSSTPPDWSVNDTTVQLSGTWFNRIDTTVAEIEGELVVTC